MDWWTFGGADAWCHASVASTWFGLRHARHLSSSPSTHSGFEIWVLHFWVLVIFESWLLRFPVLGAPFPSFGCFAFEIWVLRASVFVFELFIFKTTGETCVVLWNTTDDFLHSGRLVGLTWTHYPLLMRFGSRGPSEGRSSISSITEVLHVTFSGTSLHYCSS